MSAEGLSLPDAAKAYEAMGVALVLLKVRNKTPVYKAWPRKAEPASSWAANPEANIGANMGMSGLCSLDVDNHALTAKVFTALGLDLVSLVEMGCVVEGAPGKCRSMFSTSSPLNTFKFSHNGRVLFELRSAGGQDVLPPSIHPNTGQPYRWRPGTSPFECGAFPPVPGQLVAMWRDWDALKERMTAALESEAEGEYGKAALAGELQRLRASVQGGRNNQLFKSACSLAQLVAGDELDGEEVYKALREAALATGLSAAEVDPTLNSAFKRGEAQPRTAPPKSSNDSEAFGTEIWFAKRFVLEHGKYLRYVGAWKKWMAFDTKAKRWQEDHRNVAMLLAKTTAVTFLRQTKARLAAGTADEKALKVANSFCKLTALQHILVLASCEPEVAADVEQWDANPKCFSVAKGTVDLATGTWREALSEDYITKGSRVTFDAKAKATRWLAFLEKVLPDRAVREYLQRFLGYCLSGLSLEHVLHVFFGLGANGKTTLMEAIGFILGDYAIPAPPSLLLKGGSERHPTELATLHGRRLVQASESPEGGRLNEQMVKSLTGGDQILARRMREDFWRFWPTHKIILATNHKPRITGTDHGIWRRVKLIPFKVTISEDEKDTTLPEKLRAEAPGILNWLIEGYLAYQKAGLAPPPEVTAATDDYRQDEDLLAQFLEDEIVKAEGHFVTASEIYARYQVWCKNAGIQHLLGQRTLTKKLKERGFEDSRQKNVRGFLGLDVIHRSLPSAAAK